MINVRFIGFLFLLLIDGCASLNLPIESTNPQPVLGIWRGEYSCAQGLTGVTLILEKNPGNNHLINGTFSFFPLPFNPTVPSGSFTLKGNYTESRKLTLIPDRWIDHPFLFTMVSIDGRLYNVKTLIIRIPECGSTSVLSRE